MNLKQFNITLIAILSQVATIYSSVLIKLTDMSPMNLGFYSIALTLPIFWLMANIRKNIFKIPLKDIALMMFGGIFCASDLVFFNIALHNTSVANVNLFASLACFILIPIGVFFFKERFQKNFGIAAGIAFVGVIVLVGGKGELSVATPFGDFMAFLSVMCYSTFLSVVYSMRKRYDTLEITFFSYVGAASLLFIMSVFVEGFETPKDMKDFWVIALIAFFGQVIGQGFLNFVLGKASTQLSSILLLFTPIVAALMGFFILGEYLDGIEMLGIGIIMVGIYLARKGLY